MAPIALVAHQMVVKFYKFALIVKLHRIALLALFICIE